MSGATLDEVLEYVQRCRINAQNERERVDAEDCTTPRAHYLHGRFVALEQVENQVRRFMSEARR